MRRLTCLWLASLIALALTGCAAMVPGYIPPTPKTEKAKANLPKGGGYDESGAYSLSDQEKALDCKHMTGGITVKILQMRETRVKPSLAAAGAQSVMQILPGGGSSYGYDQGLDYKRDRARLETMNKQLEAKNCRTFNLDAELQPGNTEMPQPVGEAKPGGEIKSDKPDKKKT